MSSSLLHIMIMIMDASVVISAIHRHICHTVNIVNVIIFFYIPALICKYFFTLLYIYLFCVP